MTLLRWSCLLYEEKRGDRRSEEDRRYVPWGHAGRKGRRKRERKREKERERDHWSAATHAVKRAIKRDAARPDETRISDVDRVDAPRGEIATINRKCVTSSIALSLSLSLSLRLRSLSLSKWNRKSRATETRGVSRASNFLLIKKKGISAHVVAICKRLLHHAIDKSAQVTNRIHF